MTDLDATLKITVDGTKLYTLAYAPADGSTIDILPDFRGEDSPLPGVHGRQYLDKLRDGRMWQMPLYVLPDDASGTQTGTADQQVRTNLDALLALLGASGQRLVQRVMPNGDTRWCYAETSVEQVNDVAGDGGLVTLIATFDMADPLWYGTAVVDTARSFASSPTSFSMSVPGTARTRRVAFNVVGPNTGVRITNNTTGEFVEYTAGVLASAKHLILDAYEWTAENDGTDVQAALTHGIHVAFMEADPGSNSFTVTASSAGGTITTTITPAYW